MHLQILAVLIRNVVQMKDGYVLGEVCVQLRHIFRCLASFCVFSLILGACICH